MCFYPRNPITKNEIIRLAAISVISVVDSPSKEELKRSFTKVDTMHAKKICHVSRCAHHDDTCHAPQVPSRPTTLHVKHLNNTV